MAVNIPTINELYSTILSNLESNLGVQVPLFGKSYLRAQALVQAAKLKLYYLAIAQIQKNIFVDTADSEFIGGTLERFGRVKLGRNPFTAVAAQYTVSVTGDEGAVIPAQTTFKSDDSSLNPNKLFVLDVEYTMLAGANTILLRALEGGLESRLSIGNTLTATAPILNVDSQAVVTVETVAPQAAESLEDYRTKALQSYRLESQGGSAADYRLWAADAQGVQRVYPYAKDGFSNEIEIFVEATIADSTDGKGTPSGTLLSEVEDVIEFDPDITKPLNERGRRPLGIINIDYNPVSIREIDITITGYVGLTPAIETAIETAITSALANIRPFVSAADVLTNKNNTLNVFNIVFLIQNAVPNAAFIAVDFEVDSVETQTITFTKGDIPHLNSITYV
jgi:hypothetical protein